jgi:hypothetical protein
VRMLDDLATLSPEDLAELVQGMTPRERAGLMRLMEDEALSPYIKYGGDIKRIITEEWGEGMWSAQERIIDSFIANQRTCVVTTPGIGKSDIVSMIICAAVAAVQHNPSQIRIITTAANFRLVKTIIWPYLRRMARDHNLPGGDSKYKASRIGSTEWYINDVMIADGVASGDQDETAMRGIHSLGRVIVIVDEASGISHTIGRVLNGLLTTPEDRLVVLGNPPTDETDTWFEWFSEQAIVNTITIPYTDTPNFSGEITPVCVRCGDRIAPHTISKHLTSTISIDSVRAQYPDDDDPYVRAFLYAEFPTGNTAKTIPMSFLRKALPVELHDLDGKPMVDLDWLAKSKRVGPIVLGVDVASDGGDEFVIAKRTNWHGEVVHHSSGPDNESSVHVTSLVKAEILTALAYHEKHGIKEPVVANIDRNGVGWGVTSELQAWVVKEHLNVVVVGVMVGERARLSTRFTKQRSEIWWTMREVLQNDDTDVTLDVDALTLKQLNGPTYTTGSDGRTQVEPKASMKKRGAKSPDRADAILLAFYNSPSRRRNVVPDLWPELKQVNVHHMGQNGG